jgi:hypothetical protein
MRIIKRHFPALQTLTLALASGCASALDRARRSVEGMRRTIDSLLEFSRAGVAPRGQAWTDVRRAVAEVQEEYAPLIEQKRATVDVDVENGVAVAMELEHFRTIARNLVGNALRHGSTPAGVRISVRAATKDGRVRLEVGAAVELGRVDEHADGGDVVVRGALPDQGEMAVVERAHGRHEADGGVAEAVAQTAPEGEVDDRRHR